MKPANAAPPSPVPAPLVAGLVPRLRRLSRERGLPRAAICRYLGLHTNALNRIGDPSWHPRLDTLLLIERFLGFFEAFPERRLAGPLWLLDHDKGAWRIAGRGTKASLLGPFGDPETALAAAQTLE